MALVKVCGLTSTDDAAKALELGADALGFNFCKQSPRFISITRARELLRDLSPERNILLVGVVADPSLELLRILNEELPINAIQFHGSEQPSFCSSATEKTVIKALRISKLNSSPVNNSVSWGEKIADGQQVIENLAKVWEDSADYLLFDAFHEGALGGTGQEIPAEILERIRSLLGRGFLAGGLNAENVAARIAEYCPLGVDVASGIESSPGIKDQIKMARFIKSAKQGVV